MPRFYDLPNMYKPGGPVSYFSSRDYPLYSLNKYISNILKDYVEDENNAKISTTFSNYIRNVPIEDD